MFPYLFVPQPDSFPSSPLGCQTAGCTNHFAAFSISKNHPCPSADRSAFNVDCCFDLHEHCNDFGSQNALPLCRFVGLLSCTCFSGNFLQLCAIGNRLSGCFEKTVEGGKGERYGYHGQGLSHFIFSALDDVMGNAGVTLANTSGLTRLEFPAFSCGRRTPDEDWYEHWRSLTV